MIKAMIVSGVLVFSLICPTSVLGITEEELKFGFYLDSLMASNNTILSNTRLNKRIAEIGNTVARASDQRDISYTFRIINSPVINAYSAAGGFIYVNSGLLDVLKSQDEVAAILAHEIHHANKSHQINFIRASHRRRGIGKVLGIFSTACLTIPALTVQESAKRHPGYIDPLTLHNARQLERIAPQIGVSIANAIAVSMIKGYGKKQELEADSFAIQYTREAGYDPRALISVFKRFQSIRDRLGITERNYVSNLINAEPGLEARIKNAQKLVSKDE